MPDVSLARRIVNVTWPCALYLCCSLSMNLLTKTVLTVYGWRSVYTLAASQQVFTVALVLGGWAMQIVRLEPMPWRFFWYNVVPMALLNSLNGLIGFVCMQLVNMPMYLVLRRLTTFKVMLMEIVLLQQEIPDAMQAALLVTTIGSVVAGCNDATFDGYGYLLVIFQNCCTAMNLVLTKKSNLTPLMLVVVNSAIGMVFCVPLAMHFEYDDVVDFLANLEHPTQFYSLFVVMSTVCLLYQVAIHLCTIRTSPLATSVTGNIKDLASTVAGFLMFSDVVITPSNILGVALSFLGAYAFSYVKYNMLFVPHSTVTKPWRLRKAINSPSTKPKAY
ncbi:hypothetical protein Ae201684P_001493 [Aphanomyces euteiches]|uniref:Sugar phosphate transporter domain-containing protein n=1 Tax=Aphanomyces euteiches TaxID=100861 RepID=A0A6G0WTV5_9STRA|nr:hypothetical protein Ae201684_011757 [Aphanomyces euteiches]KAH9089290.1 hypothetical protein Ae201684P_001493 [Aphanomyces euteiches]KAH9156128.1 hypothetical protein AeRB84_001948 [Aphanomyces euteiches]